MVNMNDDFVWEGYMPLAAYVNKLMSENDWVGLVKRDNEPASDLRNCSLRNEPASDLRSYSSRLNQQADVSFDQGERLAKGIILPLANLKISKSFTPYRYIFNYTAHFKNEPFPSILRI